MVVLLGVQHLILLILSLDLDVIGDHRDRDLALRPSSKIRGRNCARMSEMSFR